MGRHILISGHRGTKIHAIENTRGAFEYCLQNKLDYIEFDVKRTADNQIVIFHDSIINRLLNGSGSIEKLTLESLRQLYYADGQHVQTLQEFFEQVGKKIRPMLEIKSRGISDQIIELIRKYGYRGNEILIQSFMGEEILACHALEPGLDYGLCIGNLGKFPFMQKSIARFMYLKKIKPYPVKWLNLDGPFMYDAIIDEVVQHGLHIILGAQFTQYYLPKLDRWHVEIVNCDDATAIRQELVKRGFQ
jgi:glycerophosphoryl diester phosphodiesterase